VIHVPPPEQSRAMNNVIITFFIKNSSYSV
jgi:hypothetical protein